MGRHTNTDNKIVSIQVKVCLMSVLINGELVSTEVLAKLPVKLLYYRLLASIRTNMAMLSKRRKYFYGYTQSIVFTSCM